MESVVEINQVTRFAIEERVAVVTVDSPPVNALGALVRQGLEQAFRRALAEPLAKAIVLMCEGRTFFAGADISEFGKPVQQPDLRSLLALIESSDKATVAAIHGAALGGGLETALACSHRLAARSAKLGLPEVKLGLAPGAGGALRLPRLIGVAKSLEMIALGVQVGADEAFAIGLVDEVADGDLRSAAVAFAERLAGEGRPIRRVRDRPVAPFAADVFDAFRAAHAKTFRGFEAPEAAIRLIERAATEPFEAGIVAEQQTFATLLASPQSAALRYVFFAERAAGKIPGLPEQTDARPVARVGVIGAGVMGGGIAMNFLSAGMPVTLVEMRQDALDRGCATMRRNFESSAAKGRSTQADVERAMGLLTGSLSLAALADCDLVVEAAYESMEVKKRIFAELDRVAKPGAILASNTSYLDIDEIAAATARPAAVLGMHFFSPANVMRLVEVVRGARTDPSVLATTIQTARRIGKLPVVAGVCHGFIGNRMLSQRQREANKLILEGTTPWEVDRVLRDFGFPMGPFQMSDLAGLDLGWSKETSKGETLRERLCELGRFGQKTSAGFYDYDAQRRGSPSPIVEALISEMSAEQGRPRRRIGEEEILERCVYPMIAEGARILEEGVACRASDIDVVWINGYGWPTYRGGPMYYADRVGLAVVRDKLRRYRELHGPDFAPAPLLERLADAGRTFQDWSARTES